MINLVRRNLLIYFRDKSTVFFSMLSVIITFGMYIFFLGDMYARSINKNGHKDICPSKSKTPLWGHIIQPD